MMMSKFKYTFLRFINRWKEKLTPINNLPTTIYYNPYCDCKTLINDKIWSYRSFVSPMISIVTTTKGKENWLYKYSLHKDIHFRIEEKKINEMAGFEGYDLADFEFEIWDFNMLLFKLKPKI